HGLRRPAGRHAPPVLQRQGHHERGDGAEHQPVPQAGLGVPPGAVRGGDRGTAPGRHRARVRGPAGPLRRRPPMGRASEALHDLTGRLDVRVVYADLDGTLLGPGGSLFAGPGGEVTTEPAAAVAALGEAGIDLMLMSGRTATQVREVARVLGAAGYIAELGGLAVHREGREEVVTRNNGSFRGPGTPFAAMERSGVAGVLLESFPGRMEPHAPWAFLSRESSMLLRGNIDPTEAATALAQAGFGWLDLQDNGIIQSWPGRFPALDPAIEEVHAYHLVPAGVSKRAGV